MPTLPRFSFFGQPKRLAWQGDPRRDANSTSYDLPLEARWGTHGLLRSLPWHRGLIEARDLPFWLLSAWKTGPAVLWGRQYGRRCADLSLSPGSVAAHGVLACREMWQPSALRHEG